MAEKLFDLGKTKSIAVESINFQDNKCFLALVEAITTLRKNVSKINRQDFFKSKEVNAITDVIKQYTNLTIKLTEGSPAIYPPILTGNHIFYDQDQMEDLRYFGVDTNDAVNKVLKKLKQTTLRGEVDLVHAKVSGIFADMEMVMMMPVDMLSREKPYLAEEVAAIILHEVGHAFTFMEFVSRASTTNQSLALLSRMLDGTVSDENRITVFSKSAKELELSKEKETALLNCKTKEQLTIILIDAGIEKSVSELGGSIYDVNSCEYLADQFATRMGAGRYLVTGLDKLVNSTGYKVIGFINMILFVWVMFSTGGVLIPFWLLILIASTHKEQDIYDNMSARINRVKLQNIEQLKDKNLSKELRAHLLVENETISKVASDYKDRLSIIETLAYYIRPGYRNAHKYEMLQKELERLASNSLFVAAAKLKNI